MTCGSAEEPLLFNGSRKLTVSLDPPVSRRVV
jgi:hypothetical protein